MKRFILMFALAIVGFCAVQCSHAPQKKTLVAYFSATGTTRAAAEKLAEALSADLYEITPESLYTAEDLDWRDSLSRSYVEMHDKSSRPAIAGTVENLDDYDTVYIGYPIWWNAAPTVINTFIESNDLTGKTLVAFATSGSSDVGDSWLALRAAYPELTWAEAALLLNGIGTAEIEELVK